jgi:hypothetical protein
MLEVVVFLILVKSKLSLTDATEVIRFKSIYRCEYKRQYHTQSSRLSKTPCSIEANNFFLKNKS